MERHQRPCRVRVVVRTTITRIHMFCSLKASADWYVFRNLRSAFFGCQGSHAVRHAVTLVVFFVSFHHPTLYPSLMAELDTDLYGGQSPVFCFLAYD